MMKLKKLATQLAFFTAITALPTISSAAVPNTFAAGDPIKASEANANNVNLDSRITSLETSTSSTIAIDFTGYSMPFATDGAEKNAIVLRSEDPVTGNISYELGVRYANSTDEISIDGVPTVKPFIYRDIYLTTDSAGNLINLGSDLRAIDSLNGNNIFGYTASNLESSFNNITPPFAKTVTQDTLTSTFTCDGNQNYICLAQDTLNLDGSLQHFEDLSFTRAIGGPITFNGLTFNDIQLLSSAGTTGDDRVPFHDRGEFVILAKGVGVIVFRDINTHSIIYHQTNGAIAGSLVGTPFEPGIGLLDGLFF